MSNITRSAQKQLVSSKSLSGATGKGMVAFGAGGIGLSFAAALIPFVGVLGLSIMLIVLGLLMWE